MTTLLSWLAPAHLALTATILIWDVVLAGRISQLRQAPRGFATITGIAGLLILPATVLHLATSTLITGRAVVGVDWIWPVVLLIFAVQAVYAVSRRLVNLAWGIPIAAYDLVIAAVEVIRYLVAHGAAPGAWPVTLLAAHGTALGVLTWSPVALHTPFFFTAPMIAPAFPALRPLTATFRLFVSVVALVWVGVIFVIGIPRAIIAKQGHERYASSRVRERPLGDFMVGLKIFPDAASPPSPAAVRSDLALVDSLDVGAVSLVVVPGASKLAIDSLGNLVDRIRRDSTRIVVSIGYRGKLVPELGRGSLDAPERIATIERVVRRLRPHVLIPAEDPYGVGARVIGWLPVATWRSHISDAARAAKAIDRNVRIGVTLSSFGLADSALYAWATRPASPVDIVGFTFYPQLRGIQDVIDAQRAADRYMNTVQSDKEHWVFAVGGFPLSQGEEGHERTIWQTLSWATDRPAIEALIVYEAGDYGQARGLRTPDGRLRPAAHALRRAIVGLQESIDPAAMTGGTGR